MCQNAAKPTPAAAASFPLRWHGRLAGKIQRMTGSPAAKGPAPAAPTFGQIMCGTTGILRNLANKTFKR